MSAQIIVLADHRTDPSSVDRLDAPAASLEAELAAVAEGGLMVDPYGLVAAVRALAADMERMRGPSAETGKACQSRADGARAGFGEANTIAEAVEKRGDISASLVYV